MLTLFVITAAGLLLPGTGPAHASESETLASPNGDVTLTVGRDDGAGHDSSDKQLAYTVRYRGSDVLLDSNLRLEFKDGPPLAADLTIDKVSRRTIQETWERVWGKRKTVVNHCNELTLELRETREPRRRINLSFRAYDDGFAYRYALPESWGGFELKAERAAFCFPDDVTVWAATYGGFHSPQEAEFNRMKLGQLATNQVYGCPMLIKIAPAVWIALTEAALTDWAGMYFTPAGDRPHTLLTRLSPRPDEPDVAVRSRAPRSSPWRVVMIGDRPGALVESDIIQNLNDPASFDASWVTPGKAAWDRWWSSSYAPDVSFKVGMNTKTMQYFVDLAGEMHWQYQLVDEGWYGAAFADGAFNTTWAAHPTSRITTAIPELDLPGLIAYAKERGVKIILWLHWGHVNEQMDEAFPLYEKWGVHGVKIDFMNRDDQEMARFYARVAKKAAEHRLVVDFHGAYKPTGLSRTYPNLVTREGVLGNEYNKWSARVTPDHNVTVPFTRGLLGEMDFTPGGFRQKTKETFRPTNDTTGTFVMGTRAHQLAMLVVYESALQVLCDSPYSYRSSPAGTDFLKVVPTTWDDTKVIHGQVGDFITVARRSGDDWYLGSMTDWDARDLEIPLGFLGPRRYQAEIWADAYEADEFPDRLMKEIRVVTGADRLTARLAPGGGHVVRLTPAQ
ncbi:MAG: glycoside hydrolase family 97 protein [Vicinamibacteria bacterium]|nr:glycoside hydrolase family 97 protein [Vicinamibacteria bacterium]